MPFITQERRDLIAKGELAKFKVGDLCYIRYKTMVEMWNEEPRWTTAHRIYADRYNLAYDQYGDENDATDLAWQVFFQLYVMPYELAKREENGDIGVKIAKERT